MRTRTVTEKGERRHSFLLDIVFAELTRRRCYVEVTHQPDERREDHVGGWVVAHSQAAGTITVQPISETDWIEVGEPVVVNVGDVVSVVIP